MSRKFITGICVSAFVLFVVMNFGIPQVLAASTGIQLLPKCAVTGDPPCGINDIVQTFVNFARLILGFVGSAVLAFFVYGGFKWVTSGGSADAVKQGKDIVVNSVIGLVIVFGAATIVQFVFLAVEGPANQANLNTQIGQPCTSGSGAGATQGIYVQVAGTTTCISSCGGLSNQGYDCRDTAKETGRNCIIGLCPGSGDSTLCCQF